MFNIKSNTRLASYLSLLMLFVCTKVHTTTLENQSSIKDTGNLIIGYIKNQNLQDFDRYIKKHDVLNEMYSCDDGEYNLIHLLAIYDHEGTMINHFFDSAKNKGKQVKMNVKTIKGSSTPLHLAADNSNVTFFEKVSQIYLASTSLMTGLNIYLRDSNNLTPEGILKKNTKKKNKKDKRKIVRILNKHKWKQVDTSISTPKKQIQIESISSKKKTSDHELVTCIKKQDIEGFKKYVKEHSDKEDIFNEKYVCNYEKHKEPNNLQTIHLLAAYDQQGILTQHFFSVAKNRQKKINMSAKTKRGWTSLHLAAHHQNASFYKILDQYKTPISATFIIGLNMFLKTNKGFTPMTIISELRRSKKNINVNTIDIIENILKINRKKWKKNTWKSRN